MNQRPQELQLDSVSGALARSARDEVPPQAVWLGQPAGLNTWAAIKLLAEEEDGNSRHGGRKPPGSGRRREPDR
jgi:hypothetical protein